MEALTVERNSAGPVQPQTAGNAFKGSSVFGSQREGFLFPVFGGARYLLFIKKEMAGTTIFTENPDVQPETKDDEYAMEYCNDDYDIVANVPFKESYKIKVKIRSITRLQPNAFIDFDELDQEF